jgi:predicted DNA-binding transcriptional regulator AlpA
VEETAAHQSATEDTTPEHPTVVGLAEIADRLGVRRGTVDQWRWRGELPEPKWTVGGRPAWHWPEIKQWAKATGRNGKGQR